MKYSNLTSTLKVSKLALGTMMWGEQTNKDEAFLQMKFALDNGINYWDTAELYTIPAKKETQGNSEKIIGEFLNKNKNERKNIILASKLAVDGIRNVTHIRNGNNKANKENINNAVNESLKRLNTDYIDIYYLHWPDRSVNIFGDRYFSYKKEEQGVAIKDTLIYLSELVKEGKIRHIAVSNESPWGVMQWLNIAKENNLEKIVTIQNPYSLLNRQFEIALSEISHYENIKLSAYSCLGMGTLSGKYLDNSLPIGSRRQLWPDYAGRYKKPNVDKAVFEYIKIANEIGITPSQLALSYSLNKIFMASVIVGGTSISQYKENIMSVDIKLNEDTIKKIERVSLDYYDLCP